MNRHRQIAQAMRAQAPSGPVYPAGSMAWTIEVTAPDQLYTVGNNFKTRQPNFEIFWGDGASNTITSGYATINHTYANAGVYHVYCVGNVTFARPDGGGDPILISFDQFGDHAFTLVTNMFASNSPFQILATNAPNISGITSLQSMFYATNAITGADGGPYTFPGWDTAHVTNWYTFAGYSKAPLNFDMSGLSFASMSNGGFFMDGQRFESSALYDKFLIQVDATVTNTGFNLGMGDSVYTSAASAARARIVDPGVHNISLSDGGLES